jgi:hypothetical protein
MGNNAQPISEVNLNTVCPAYTHQIPTNRVRPYVKVALATAVMGAPATGPAPADEPGSDEPTPAAASVADRITRRKEDT